jgi:hypothetical protein
MRNYSARTTLVIAVLLLLIWYPSAVKARVFQMTKESVAAYFGGTYSPSLLKQTHFSGTSGTDVTIDKSFLVNYGGEFGVLFTSQFLGLRLGAELIKPGNLIKATGSDAGGTALYNFESGISALIPKATIEFNLDTTNSWRLFLSLGLGTASVTYKNTYTLTAAGQAAYPGLADFTEEGTGSARLWDAGLGTEALMNDTTTVVLAVGYRNLAISKYKYKADVTSFDGAHLSGTEVLNSDGTNKQSTFTGTVVSLLFRFYLGK